MFLHESTYLLTLQISNVILDEHGQACPKRLLKLSKVFFLRHSKTVGVPKLIFGHLHSGESDHFTLCID